MREKQLGGRSWQARATQLVLAGTLALSMVPATALAATVADGGNNQANNQVLATGADASSLMWADGAWVKDPKTVTNGIYQWKTTIKGDGSHYGHYDALITFTVKNKVLTAVDLTSPGTTFGGQWGVITPKSTNVTGYLPQGVSLEEGAVQDATSGGPVSVKLAGAEIYGGATVSAIALCTVQPDGTLETETQEVVDPDDGDIDLKEVVKGYNVADSLTAASAASASVTGRARPGAGPSLATASSADKTVVDWNHEDQALTLAEGARSEYNLAIVSYKIGDYFVFDQYIALDGANGMGCTYDIQATDLSMEPSGIGAKNRDVYTAAAFAVMLQRQLVSWQGVSGVKENLDVVSAATKSSDSLVEAIYAAYGYRYPASNYENPQELMAPAAWGQLFTSVADDVQLTIDKGKSSESSIWDQTSVKVNAAGDYELTYKLSDSIPVSALKFYSSSTKLNAESMSKLNTTGTPKEQFITANTADHGICANLGDDEVSSSNVSWNSATKTITIKKNSGINYVLVGLGVGKLAQNGIYYVPYSLEEMAAASSVTSQIQKMSATDYNAVTAARTAYNALSTDARTFVGRAEVAKLLAANPAKPATATPAPAAPAAVSKTVAQKLTVSNTAKAIATSKVSAGKLKAKTTFSLKTTGAKGKVTYKVSSIGATAKKYLSISSAGKVTVKKGTPVGSYTMKVKVSAAKATAKAGNVTTTYPAASATKTVTVTVGAQSVSLTSSKAVKYTAVKKKAQALALTAKTSSGKITSVKNVSTDKTAKKFKVKKTSNKKITVTVPKGTKKGTYTLKVTVKAPKVAKKYVAASVTKTVKVTVK